MRNNYRFFCLLCAALFLMTQPSLAYEEVSYSDVMRKLEVENQQLFKMAEKVYIYATTNTTDIIDKPLLTRHNKGLNGVIDRKNKVSAKYFAVGQDGLQSKMVMLFKFGGEKYKVIQNYARDSKFSKWKPLK